MQSTEQVSLPENSDKSLSEWPTLNDVCNNAKKTVSVATTSKIVRKGGKRNKPTAEKNGGYDSSKENEVSEAVNSRGARKKSSLKTKWVPVPIVPQPYKKRGYGRHFYDSNRNMNGDKKNESVDYVNKGENGRMEYGSMRGYNRFRNKRGRGFSHSWKPRNEETSRFEAGKDSDATFEAMSFYNNAIFYDPFLHNMYASALRDRQLQKAIRLQIEYYFSEDNLVKDIYMRRKMDALGYVPLTLISTFHRVKNLTDNMDVIVEAVKDSSKLEMIDNAKVRPVVDPLKWPLPDTFVVLRSDVPEFVPGQPYIGSILEGMDDLNLNADDHYLHSPESLSITADNMVGNYLNDQLVNVPYFPDSASPPEINMYFPETSADLYIANTCEFFSSTSSPEESVNAFDYYSEPISNGVLYYAPNVICNDPVADGTNGSCQLTPDDDQTSSTSTGTDNSTEDNHEVLKNYLPTTNSLKFKT